MPKAFAAPRPAALGAGGRDHSPEMYLGFLYLAHESGRLPMDRLLQEAGRFADAHGDRGVPECEAFYQLLNEIDGRRPTRPSNRPLADRGPRPVRSHGREGEGGSAGPSAGIKSVRRMTRLPP